VGTLLVLFEVSANTHALTNNLTTLFAAHKEWQKRSRPDCPSAFWKFCRFSKRETKRFYYVRRPQTTAVVCLRGSARQR